MKYTCDCRQSRKGKQYNKEKQGREPMKVTVAKDGQCVYCNHYAVAVPRTYNLDTTDKYYASPVNNNIELHYLTQIRVGGF